MQGTANSMNTASSMDAMPVFTLILVLFAVQI